MAFQIIHSFEKFINRFDYSGDFETVLQNCLNDMIKMNIDGLVVNINNENGYLENDENWVNFIAGMRIAVKLGFRIWIYDEKGYPSGGAGGFVLRDNPELEAKGIKFHEGNYFISNIYEGSHAERNFHEKRKYINLLDSKAVQKFTDITYYQYKKKLPADIFSKVEAFFTDEPSLMTVVTQVLDGSVEDDVPEMLDGFLGKKIPAHDEPDPNVPITPSIPYSEELNTRYKKKYGRNILEASPDVFKYSNTPSEEKCRFWEAVALTYEKAYGRVLSDACEDLDKKLTGHLLFEETPILNVAFHSNPFRVLKCFQLPGIDLLSNIQEKISVFAHKMVSTCAWLKNTNGIMTETSDFFEYRMGVKRPTKKKKILAALYRQFALGVREFSFYYNFGIRSEEEYGEIAGTIKNLCEFGKDLIFKPDCAAYCAYETVWAGFYPSLATPFELYDKQPEFVQNFESSILNICEEFYLNNTQFIMIDESSIDDMVEKGISNVVLPECKVVDRRLIELASEEKIKLYGNQPEYTYADGELEKPANIPIYPISDIADSISHFQYEGSLIYTKYEGGVYFCFNPEGENVNILINEQCNIYNPTVDESHEYRKGESYILEPDSAVIIRFDR